MATPNAISQWQGPLLWQTQCPIGSPCGSRFLTISDGFPKVYVLYYISNIYVKIEIQYSLTIIGDNIINI